MPVTRVKRPRTSTLKKATATTKRRRTSNVTKVKWQRPTARNQRRQIMSNARKVNSLARIVYQQRVWTDYQAIGTAYAVVDTSGSFTTTWSAFPLTDFPNWTSVLRKDENATESSVTFLKRLQLNFRYSLNSGNWAQFNTFIVTLRKDNAANDIVSSINAGATPSQGPDYIAGPNGFNIRLNSAQFKVHFARYVTLTENALFESSTNRTAGNPMTTFKKGQVTMPINKRYRAPAGNTNGWKQISYQSQPYYSRYFLLSYIVQGQDANLQPDTCARLDWDMMATCVNFA